MNFNLSIKWSLILSTFLLILIYFLTNKKTEPYKYELKYIENPKILSQLIQKDSLLNTQLYNYSKEHQSSYNDALIRCIAFCNEQRKLLLSDSYYSTLHKANALGVSQNTYINTICIDSLKLNINDIFIK